MTLRGARLPEIAAIPKIYSGKVRDVHDAGEGRLLLVTSQRVSAYDVVFPEPVPAKAQVLNLLSAWWFRELRGLVPNHLIETRAAAIFVDGAACADELRGRVSLVERTTPIRFECVVRGYLDGSAWREHAATGRVGEFDLPRPLKRHDKLPAPIFTPATKAESGHDENVSRAFVANALGGDLAAKLEATSLAVYQHAHDLLAPRGIVLVDTKLEFGQRADGTLVLIDEVLTPDSSRYRVAEGGDAQAFDKQYLRDWLTDRGFRGDGPAPALPREVIDELSRRYRAILRMITGEELEAAVAREG